MKIDKLSDLIIVKMTMKLTIVCNSNEAHLKFRIHKVRDEIH